MGKNQTEENNVLTRRRNDIKDHKNAYLINSIVAIDSHRVHHHPSHWGYGFKKEGLVVNITPLGKNNSSRRQYDLTGLTTFAISVLWLINSQNQTLVGIIEQV